MMTKKCRKKSRAYPQQEGESNRRRRSRKKSVAKHMTRQNEMVEPADSNQPEEDAIQIHTDGDEIPQGENTDNKIRRSSRNINKPNRYGSVPYTGNFWG